MFDVTGAAWDDTAEPFGIRIGLEEMTVTEVNGQTFTVTRPNPEAHDTEGRAPMADEEPPHRRLRLKLDLEADDLHELAYALTVIGNDLELEGAEMREITSGGYASGHHLVLTCDDSMDHDRFTGLLAEWIQQRRANRTTEEQAHG